MQQKVKTGPKNLITDVAGVLVGNAEDHEIKTGTTVLVGEEPFVAGYHVMGGAPGTRETDLLAPDKTVEAFDGFVLSGGSAFGLDAGAGVMDAMAKDGRGFQVGHVRVPIAPAAIVFDLINGGDKSWNVNPYRQLGETAYAKASMDFQLGSVGAGTGALTAGLKGGLGSASLVLESGITIGALVVANPLGAVVDSNGHFHAALQEIDGEFGGKGPAQSLQDFGETLRTKGDFLAELQNEGSNTTIAIVATDAVLTKAQATRMAIAAHDGMARAIVPSHTPLDGDLVFALSTGKMAASEDDMFVLGHAAANCLSRAIARAVYEATPAEGDIMPTWRQVLASSRQD